MANIIIVGGAGFIGSHLVDCMVDADHMITVLDNFSTGRPENLEHIKSKINLIECDVGIAGDWQSVFADAHYVFHLAALADIVPSIQNPTDYFHSNVTGTLNVLEACRDAPLRKVVYVASSSAYGIPKSYPTNENSDIKPQYPYALTKWLGEELILHWAKVYSLPVISLRLFNVYGPRSRTSGTYGAVFGVFLAQKLAGKPFTIVGDGSQTRDFTYVSDVVNALHVAAKSEKEGEVYNVGSGNTVSVNRIADLIGGPRVYIPKRPGEPDCTFADISKIQEDLAWSPIVSIEEGVSNLLNEISYWSAAPVWTEELIEEATSDWFKYLAEK